MSFTDLPDKSPTRPMPRLHSVISKFRLSKPGANRMRQIVEGEVVGQLEDESELTGLERQLTTSEARLRADHHLSDQNRRLAALSSMRALDFQGAVQLKSINLINDFWRQTEELRERYTDDSTLQELVAEKRRQFLRERRSEEIR